MTPKYLYPRQRQIEVIGAIITGGFGEYVKVVDVFTGHRLLQGLGLSHLGESYLSTALILCAAVWVLGIRINGRWIGSPFLRLACLFVNAEISIYATIHGIATVAFYPCVWVSALLVAGVCNAARDCALAIGAAKYGLE